MKMLPGWDDPNPNHPNSDGKTQLRWAANNEHMGVVQVPLKQDEVSSDQLTECDQTPLEWAVKNGHNQAVKILSNTHLL